MFLNDRTEIGRRAEEIVKSGGLVPDDIMLEIVSSKLAQLGNKVRYHIDVP
jgi:nucleoside-triphosphate--adenylate kinase